MCLVPQGLVFGPVLFILYMAYLADVATEHNMSFHDNNQLYIHYCQSEDSQSAVLSVQYCISVIEQWMTASRCRLNMDKN